MYEITGDESRRTVCLLLTLAIQLWKNKDILKGHDFKSLPGWVNIVPPIAPDVMLSVQVCLLVEMLSVLASSDMY